MFAIKEKIDSLSTANEDVRREIIKGSDEHLDIILDLKGKFDSLTKNCQSFLDGIEEMLNGCEAEIIRSEYLPGLKKLMASFNLVIARVRSSSFKNDINVSFTAYKIVAEHLREVIYDLEHFRTKKNDELEKILAEINTF